MSYVLTLELNLNKLNINIIKNKFMFSSKKSLLQVLLLVLFLLAGQLQAQTVFTCSLTNESKHNATINMQDEETCSHEHKACLNFDCNDVASLNTDSCYKKIVLPSTDQDVQLNTMIPDLVVEPGEDLPQVFTTLDLLFQLQTVDPLHLFSRTNHVHVGSKIHLITQRLRI